MPIKNPARMVRKQVYIEPRQEEMLKRRAAELAVTEAELIRRGIDLVTRQAAKPWPDPEAWQRALEFMRERARHPLPERDRSWTRDEIYDERLARVSRRH